MEENKARKENLDLILVELYDLLSKFCISKEIFLINDLNSQQNVWEYFINCIFTDNLFSLKLSDLEINEIKNSLWNKNNDIEPSWGCVLS